MFNRRFAATLGTIALVLAACTGGGDESSEPAASEPAGSEPAASESAAAGECTVAVSWNNFQQPRWAAKDKPNIQETVEAGVAERTSTPMPTSTPSSS